MTASHGIADLLIVGGGINGVGIARDAAGRGLKVTLVEQDDLASATSSASSKLIHGGLRYLEHYQFALVRESLHERATLLDIAPHLVKPKRFVLPHVKGMRPAWMLRSGLFFYDHLGAAHAGLASSRSLDFSRDREGLALNNLAKAGFEYADCTVDDSRLVVMTAMDAKTRGANILTRTRLVSARVEDGLWRATLEDRRTGRTWAARARALVNVAGPWARRLIDTLEGAPSAKDVRLVKGSHIVVDRLYEGEHAYILQNDDERVVFVIPYQGRFTLIGTTEVELDSTTEMEQDGPACSIAETCYLCHAVNRYFRNQIAPQDVRWSFAGVRPLVRDKKASASAATREYAFEWETVAGAPVLSVFGGKLTTYRRLSESAVDKLARHFPNAGPAWTDGALLPGGDIGHDAQAALAAFKAAHPGIAPEILEGLFARHGALAQTVLSGAQATAELGRDFGHGLTAREVEYMKTHEWAETADDVLWRRSKLGLCLGASAREALWSFMSAKPGA